MQLLRHLPSLTGHTELEVLSWGCREALMSPPPQMLRPDCTCGCAPLSILLNEELSSEELDCHPVVQVAKAVFMNRKLQWPASTPVKYRKLASACMAYDPEDRPMFSECVEQLHNMWAM